MLLSIGCLLAPLITLLHKLLIHVSHLRDSFKHVVVAIHFADDQAGNNVLLSIVLPIFILVRHLLIGHKAIRGSPHLNRGRDVHTKYHCRFEVFDRDHAVDDQMEATQVQVMSIWFEERLLHVDWSYEGAL